MNTTLLRERFVIRDQGQDMTGDAVVATSNRLVVPLIDSAGKIVETFVVRSRTMHTAVRMASQIVRAFVKSGPLMSRSSPFDFEEIRPMVVPQHDLDFGQDGEMWLCVYYASKPVYEFGVYHTFLDVIEKCDSKNSGNYDASVSIAEAMFKKMGRTVTIQHNANIGLVVNVTNLSARCGMVLRNPHKGTTFNYTAEKKADGLDLNPSLCLNACAAFLEGIQLSVRVGMLYGKFPPGKVTMIGPDAREARSALARLQELKKEIKSFENRFDVYYRLERPEFQDIIREAERFQRQMLV